MHKSAVLVGEESILCLCAEKLLDADIRPVAIVSTSPMVVEWAQERAIACTNTLEAVIDLVPERPDYLFSITNFAIIPKPVLRWVTQRCVNFHDGPLPELAGLNTPSYALLNGHKEHAVTWHELTEEVDAGAILVRKDFEIPQPCDLFQLNTLCFEAALESFDAVLSAIQHPSQIQGTSPHHYVRRDFKLPHLGFIDWRQPKQVIQRQFLSTASHGYRNPLGTLKFVHRGQHFSLTSAETGTGAGQPGEVLSVDPAIEVACADGSIVCTVARELSVTVGDVLAGPDAVLEVFRNDGSWRLNEARLLQNLSEVTATVLPSLASTPGEGVRHTLSFKLPGQVKRELVLASILGFVSCINGQAHSSVRISSSQIRQVAKATGEYFVNYFVCNYPADAASLERTALEVLDGDAAYQLMPCDLQERYPQASLPALDSLCALPLIHLGSWDTSRDEDAIAIDFETGELTLSAQLTETSYATYERFIELTLQQSTVDGLKDFSLFDPDADLQNKAVGVVSDGFTSIPARIDQVSASDAIAISDRQGEFTYDQLISYSNRVHANLVAHGVEPGGTIGVLLPKNRHTIAILLGILKAGCAYIPLDPEYPAKRIRYVVEDAHPLFVVGAQAVCDQLGLDAPLLSVDTLFAVPSQSNVTVEVATQDRAYVIYTSGSTGMPKGVEISHQNMSNFVDAMNLELGHGAINMLSVTSLSFDISVLEIWWTLSNGGKVVCYETDSSVESVSQNVQSSTPEFGLFFWNSTSANQSAQPYELLLSCAEYADQNGYSSIWTPERHFGDFGGAYPNPSVIGAALAATTERIGIRAGSCVAPLHHPVRIAEDWSVIDNLSQGRVGISFASGWMPRDFVLAPGSYADAKSNMWQTIETVSQLWLGSSIEFEGPTGIESISTLPRPVQAQLPIWVTAAGSLATFEQAGKKGYGILTHMLGQSLEQLTTNLAAYHAAYVAAGHEHAPRLTVMLHTFLAETEAVAASYAREPMKQFLGTSLSLVKDATWDFPTFAKLSEQEKADTDQFFNDLDDEDLDALLEHAFNRYFQSNGLFGTPESAAKMVRNLADIGVTEVGCLVDFGIDGQVVLQHLRYLDTLRQEFAKDHAMDSAMQRSMASQPLQQSLQAWIQEHAITHLQCTPSQFNMFLLDDQDDGFKSLEILLLGGEALDQSTADRACELVTNGAVLNMYGPTETTVWSLTKRLKPSAPVTIGGPIANTSIRVLDEAGRRCPVGVPGELVIGGKGVALGYLGQPQLTAERFLQLGSDRYYATGDLVRWLSDGEVEYLGRNDHQLKVRGYRIEAGEIENALLELPDIDRAVVLGVADQWGATEIVAVLQGKQQLPSASLRQALGERLPDYMIPSKYRYVDAYPYTANGKLDRTQLAKVIAIKQPKAALSGPRREQTQTSRSAKNGNLKDEIRALWCELLDLDDLADDTNFFEAGGHSILAVRMQGRLSAIVGSKVPISLIFNQPTVAGLSDALQTNAGKPQSSQVKKTASDRAAKRRASRNRRSI